LNNESLNICIKETLRRWGPAAALIPRIILKNVNIDGIELKKGEICTFPMAGINEDPKYFENGETWNPLRYLDKEWVRKLPKQLDIPFSLGSRACTGKYLAMQELKIN